MMVASALVGVATVQSFAPLVPAVPVVPPCPALPVVPAVPIAPAVPVEPAVPVLLLLLPHPIGASATSGAMTSEKRAIVATVLTNMRGLHGILKFLRFFRTVPVLLLYTSIVVSCGCK